MALTTGQVAPLAVLAILTCWVVGAHSRLVRLRAEVVRQFAPFETQFESRHALLQQQLEATGPVLASAAGPRLQALREACQQAQSACALARTRPYTLETITALRVAEDVLAEARGRLPAQGAATGELADLPQQLRAVDVTLAFARAQFNEAVDTYNQAMRQFPTLLVAAIFRIRPAALL